MVLPKIKSQQKCSVSPNLTTLKAYKAGDTGDLASADAATVIAHEGSPPPVNK